MFDYGWLLVVGAALGGGIAGGAGGWLLKTLADRQHRRLVRTYVQEVVHASRASGTPPPLPIASGRGSRKSAGSAEVQTGKHRPAALVGAAVSTGGPSSDQDVEQLATAVFVPGKLGPKSVIRTVVPPPLPAGARQVAKVDAADGLHTSVVQEAAWKAFAEDRDARTPAVGINVTALFDHAALAKMLEADEHAGVAHHAGLAELLEGEERAS